MNEVVRLGNDVTRLCSLPVASSSIFNSGKPTGKREAPRGFRTERGLGKLRIHLPSPAHGVGSSHRCCAGKGPFHECAMADAGLMDSVGAR